MIFVIFLFTQVALALPNVRNVTSSSCGAIRVNLGIGITTQLVFEQDPKVTLFADKKHFKISTNQLAKRSLAIIPYFESAEIDLFRNSNGQFASARALASQLDKNYKTNLFIFFDNNNQLMFDLRFVAKEKADYIVRVTQSFPKGCSL